MKPAKILARVALRHGYTVDQLAARDRHRSISHARQRAWCDLRAVGWSYPEIGQAFGNRDHTTVMSGVAAAIARGYVSTFTLAPGPVAPAVLPEVPDLLPGRAA